MLLYAAHHDEPTERATSSRRFESCYWGKAQPRDPGGPAWHPLAYHSLDVAAAMDALLDVRPRLLAAVADIAGLSLVEARRMLCFVAAVHDLGKFGDDFQIKVPHLWQGRASYLAERRHAEPPRGSGHGVLGAAIWARLTDGGAEGEFAPLRRVRAWALAAFAHHGRPVDGVRLELADLISDTALADATAFLRLVSRLFPPPAVPVASQAARRSAWIVAGLAILADWLGSNQTWFPYRSPDLTAENYWPIAREQAARAVRESGLAEGSVAPSFGLADALGGAGPTPPDPTPLQAWAAEQSFAAPSLVILEDLTGSGKTEAALILAHRMMQAGQAEGLYWALPTMATADSLHLRLARAYRALFLGGAPSLVLTHGASDLNAAFLASIAGPGAPGEAYPAGEDAAIGDAPASASCAAWIADDRRTAFLAEVGVGTIDQALLAALPVKHQSLRLAALARRVLVVDEAHAFDEYQGRLLEALLAFQAALGGSAIVLSATLPLDRRARFAAAYAKGAGRPVADRGEAAFPLATTISAGQVQHAPMMSSRGTRRDLPVRRLDKEEDADSVLTAAVAEDACAAWVRNTVQDAIDTAARLRETTGREVMLFHARFALGDRLRRQDEVLARFGKGGTRTDRARHLLIATQVIEQSIDVDWDHLVSDLAPIDLLIQRAGRLQRHDRGARAAPVLQVLGPAAHENADEDWYARAFAHGQFVYPDHGRLWLTARTLEAFGGLPLLSRSPRGLIEAVYGPEAETIPTALQKRSDDAEAERLQDRWIANLNKLDVTGGFTLSAGAWESDTRTPTRLGDDTRIVRLARWDGRSLRPWADDETPRRAWRMSEVRLRAARVAEAVPPEPACAAAIAAEVARWPDRRFDPPLVLPLIEGEGGTWEGAIVGARGHRLVVAYDAVDGLRFLVR